MKEARTQEVISPTEDLQRLCREVHHQTGVFIRVSSPDDLNSLRSLVKLSCSHSLLERYNRIRSAALQTTFLYG